MNPLEPDRKRISEHLRHISRGRNFETDPKGLREVESYIKEEFLSYGLLLQEERFSFAGQTYSNLVARTSPGSSSSRFIIGAHFDAVPGSPGADDNASGVAALLEAARLWTEILKKANLSPSGARVDVEFAAFNIEEYGMVGSQTYAQKLKTEGVQVAGMLSLEMVGYTSQEKGSQKMPLVLKPFYPDVGNFIGLVANGASKGLLKEIETIFRSVPGLPVESLTLPGKGWIFPDARLSDHSPFWDLGYPALLVTDTSFFRNPYYHSSEDRVETLDLDFLEKVTEAVVRTVRYFFLGEQAEHGQTERR